MPSLYSFHTFLSSSVVPKKLPTQRSILRINESEMNVLKILHEENLFKSKMFDAKHTY